MTGARFLATATWGARLAIVGWLVAIVGGVGGFLARIAWPAPIPETAFGVGPTNLFTFAVLGIAWSTVGAILVIRRRENPVGRIMIVVGAVHATSVLTVAVAFAALAEGTASGRDVASVALALLTLLGPALVLVLYLAFIFPTGRGHTPRWQTISHAWLWTFMILNALLILQPGDVPTMTGIRNPFGFGPDLRPVFGEQATNGVAALSVAVTSPLLIVSVAMRFRGAGPIERQQLKWFIFATVATFGAAAVTFVVAPLAPGPMGEGPLVVFALAGTTVPAAVGMAILRYRLYEIDRIISRTIGWALVTGLLVTVFAGAVVALQGLLAGFTQGQTLAVAGSTLVAFALFQPVRRRVQSVVDRRFDRARYDAQRTVDAFAQRLRDETDMDKVTNDLSGTASSTVAPASLTIWLRPGNGGA